MKALKITKDETIRHGNGYVTNGHYMFIAGENTVSDKSVQSLIDAGIQFSRSKVGGLLMGDKALTFDAERVIPEKMGDDKILRETSFLFKHSNGDVYQVFKHDSGRVVGVDVRYSPLWENRLCTQKEALSAIRVENSQGEVVAVVMPVNVEKDLIREIRFMANDIPAL